MSLLRTVRLADPATALPNPAVPGALVGPDPFTVSLIDPFWSQCIADGSLIEIPAPPPPANASAPGPDEPAPKTDKPPAKGA